MNCTLLTLSLLNKLQVGDKGMVLITWRDGQDSRLQAVVVERRPCDFWKRRSKKRKLQKKSSGDVSTATNGTNSKPATSSAGGGLKNDNQVLEGVKGKLTGISSLENELDGLKADQIDYYVHYVDHDR